MRALLYQSVLWMLSLPLSSCQRLEAPLDYSDEAFDLYSFVTRPDLQPPKLNVTVLDPHKVSPGYFFAAPYAGLNAQASFASYRTAQIGPAIYDSQGELVWSGAKLFKDRATFDFRVSTVDDVPHLSFVLLEDMKDSKYKGGAYVLLNSSYQVVDTMVETAGQGTVNMHEFQVIDNGNSALLITSNPRFVESPKESHATVDSWLLDGGFKEVDLETSKPVFEWWALDHDINVSDSYEQLESGKDAASAADFFHLNSVDKTLDGNYIISARHVSTVYLIDGKDGSMLWQLGGTESSFKLQGFSFSGQHDARFVSKTESGMLISLFDNAVNNRDIKGATANYSSAKYIALDTNTWTASLVREIKRLDGGMTMLRGNAQTIPETHNTVVGWSQNNYFSEHTEDLETVLVGRYTSFRFVNYRTWKFPWKSVRPSEPPIAKGFAYGTTPAKAVMNLHVSWNGATEVSRWKFYCTDDSHTKNAQLIADVKKTGFETSAAAEGFCKQFYAQAVAADGEELGETAVYQTIIPSKWVANNDLTAESVHEEATKPQSHSVTSSHSGPNSGSRPLPTLRLVPIESDKILNVYGLAGISGLLLCIALYWRRKRAEADFFYV